MINLGLGFPMRPRKHETRACQLLIARQTSPCRTCPRHVRPLCETNSCTRLPREAIFQQDLIACQEHTEATPWRQNKEREWSGGEAWDRSTNPWINSVNLRFWHRADIKWKSLDLRTARWVDFFFFFFWNCDTANRNLRSRCTIS